MSRAQLAVFLERSATANGVAACDAFFSALVKKRFEEAARVLAADLCWFEETMGRREWLTRARSAHAGAALEWRPRAELPKELLALIPPEHQAAFFGAALDPTESVSLHDVVRDGVRVTLGVVARGGEIRRVFDPRPLGQSPSLSPVCS